MLIKYYKNKDLSFASRNRYKDISQFEWSYEEEQRSVKFGDGTKCTVKTSVDNICDYVTIGSTRWFVISHFYMNGGQVTLSLLRDVVGEFGLEGCYGKIERGHTDGILKYRKELSLNERLVKRIPLIPNNDYYGNFYVNNHNAEMWGVLYFTKDSDNKKTSINIPAFTPVYEQKIELPAIEHYRADGILTKKITHYVVIKSISSYSSSGFQYTVYKYSIDFVANSISYVTRVSTLYSVPSLSCILLEVSDIRDVSISTIDGLARTFVNKMLGYGNEVLGLTDPPISENSPSGLIPTNQTVNYKTDVNSDITQYNLVREPDMSYGSFDIDVFKDYVNSIPSFIYSLETVNVSFKDGDGDSVVSVSEFNFTDVYYTTKTISGADAGNIEIDNSLQLVDEPYVILVVPLYDVVINGKGKTYNINRGVAFNAFNTVIEALSGENAFLVDAQIFPYCPDLLDEATNLKVDDNTIFPFFSIMTTSFTRSCTVQLQPKMDVKKEYIERSYSVVSPDNTGRFTFNFYDYVNDFETVQGGNPDINYKPILFHVKTALKPYAIISYAVIYREGSQETLSLKGINYSTNFEGCAPASGGFECSLASSAFETYKRQNSNYQQIFKLDQEELAKSHEVEAFNDLAQGVANVVTQTTFGAIAGGAMADAGVVGNAFGAKMAGAIGGAALAGGTAAYFSAKQVDLNNDLRKYERELQQQRFDLSIGTIKNLPNTISRISSFNELIMTEFFYYVEVYECTDEEKEIVNNFVSNYGYGIGIYEYFNKFHKNGWFLKGELLKSYLNVSLSELLSNDLGGGVYYNE